MKNLFKDLEKKTTDFPTYDDYEGALRGMMILHVRAMNF
jgi:hypothetical protein